MHPFYLPREFGNIIVCLVYIPHSGNAVRAANIISDCVHSPGAPFFVLGDINHCKLEPALAGFQQYVKHSTRNTNVLDKYFVNVAGSYRSKILPPIANSDPSTVYLMPTYKSVLKSSKPQLKTVLRWTKDSTETLRSCFLSTDWSIFHSSDLEEATVIITDYITWWEKKKYDISQ